MLNLFVGIERDSFGWRKDQDGVGDCLELIDGGGVDVVDVVAGVENGGHQLQGDALLHLVGYGDVAGGEGGLGIIFRQENGDVVGRFALAQEPAYALEVFVDIRHEGEPGIVGVKDGCCVEAPAGLGGGRWRVGVAVADELVYAQEKHAVRFGFHIEWSCAEGGGMQPCPGFGGGDVAVVEMAC